MGREINVLLAQGFDVSNFLKDVPNFVKNIPRVLKFVLSREQPPITSLWVPKGKNGPWIII